MLKSDNAKIRQFCKLVLSDPKAPFLYQQASKKYRLQPEFPSMVQRNREGIEGVKEGKAGMKWKGHLAAQGQK